MQNQIFITDRKSTVCTGRAAGAEVVPASWPAKLLVGFSASSILSSNLQSVVVAGSAATASGF